MRHLFLEPPQERSGRPVEQANAKVSDITFRAALGEQLTRDSDLAAIALGLEQRRCEAPRGRSGHALTGLLLFAGERIPQPIRRPTSKPLNAVRCLLYTVHTKVTRAIRTKPALSCREGPETYLAIFPKSLRSS